MAPAGLPLLRKDFILHPLQVRLTAATPASALLLIVRLTPDVRRLRGLRELAESFGMEAVVEIFSAEELVLARESGARVIQVNARDLDTLRVDRTACLNMGAARRDGEIWIAASGMSEPDHLRRAAEAGFDAALGRFRAHGRSRSRRGSGPADRENGSAIMIVKICGMRDQNALDAASACGADMVGFIFAPGSPRFLSPDTAARLDTGRMARVGVFTGNDAETMLDIAAQAKLDFLQLHGSQSESLAAELSARFGAERLIRVFWPQRYTGTSEMERAMDEAAPHAGLFLLDAGTDGGGHGVRLDASALAGLDAPRPWLLAGGLTPANVAEAVARCRPDGADLNSGLESSPGRKEPALIRSALAALGGVGKVRSHRIPPAGA